MRLFALLLPVLAACTAPPRVEIQRVSVLVPVECRVQTPARPAMPTESLTEDVALDTFVAAAQAEIERREGYEGQLRAALSECTSPLVE